LGTLDGLVASIQMDLICPTGVRLDQGTAPQSPNGALNPVAYVESGPLALVCEVIREPSFDSYIGRGRPRR